MGFAILLKDKILSVNKEGEEEIIPTSDVKKYYSEKIDYGKSFFAVVGSIGLLIVLTFGMLLLIFSGHSIGG